MKSEDAGVKNGILTPGRERKKRIHQIEISISRKALISSITPPGLKHSSSLASEKGVTDKSGSSRLENQDSLLSISSNSSLKRGFTSLEMYSSSNSKRGFE
ncbi:hypothetical protein Tco_1477622 [Tanacetum coccineum]